METIKMISAKELSNLFIKWEMRRRKAEQQKKSYLQGVLTTWHNLSDRQLRFINFVNENVYKGNTAYDRFKQRFGDNFQPTYDYMESIGYDRQQAQALIEKESKESDRRINSYFEKYRVELNDILNG